MVRFGINGFGRLGRTILKISVEKCGQKGSPCDIPRAVVVNDPNVSPVCMGYLFGNDTFYGRSKQEIVNIGTCLVIEGQRIEALQEPDVEKIPWSKACPIEYIVDATGRNTTCGTASRHLKSNIQRVITTGTKSDIPIYVFGVNHTCFKNDMKIISAASPSLNCLATMLRVIHENFNIQKAMATAIHPLNNSDKILDDASASGNCRDSRSAVMSFAPTETSAAGCCVGRIMPELEGKVEATALRVPVPCVGAVMLTAVVEKEVSYDVVKVRLKEAADSYMRGIMRYSNEEIVSSDIIGDPHSCVIDAKAGTHVSRNMIKVFGWYDGEYAFAHRIYDMVKYISSREN